jgi:hypothetical protein
MRGDKPFAGRPRGESDGPTEHRLHREVGIESAGSNGGLQRSDVDMEFVGQLSEGQQLGLSRVMRDHRSSPLQYRRRHGAEPAVPHAKRIDGDGHPRSTFVLREIGGTTQFAQIGHTVDTMPCGRGIVKRPPE